MKGLAGKAAAAAGRCSLQMLSVERSVDVAR